MDVKLAKATTELNPSSIDCDPEKVNKRISELEKFVVHGQAPPAHVVKEMRERLRDVDRLFCQKLCPAFLEVIEKRHLQNVNQRLMTVQELEKQALAHGIELKHGFDLSMREVAVSQKTRETIRSVQKQLHCLFRVRFHDDFLEQMHNSENDHLLDLERRASSRVDKQLSTDSYSGIRKISLCKHLCKKYKIKQPEKLSDLTARCALVCLYNARNVPISFCIVEIEVPLKLAASYGWKSKILRALKVRDEEDGEVSLFFVLTYKSLITGYNGVHELALPSSTFRLHSSINLEAECADVRVVAELRNGCYCCEQISSQKKFVLRRYLTGTAEGCCVWNFLPQGLKKCGSWFDRSVWWLQRTSEPDAAAASVQEPLRSYCQWLLQLKRGEAKLTQHLKTPTQLCQAHQAQQLLVATLHSKTNPVLRDFALLMFFECGLYFEEGEECAVQSKRCKRKNPDAVLPLYNPSIQCTSSEVGFNCTHAFAQVAHYEDFCTCKELDECMLELGVTL